MLQERTAWLAEQGPTDLDEPPPLQLPQLAEAISEPVVAKDRHTVLRLTVELLL